MPKYIQNDIKINAPAAEVWDALVNPEKTKVYMFGCETVSDWQEGSPLLWQMEYEGKPFVPVKGHIVELDKNEYLAYTVFDPHATMPDIPENYLTVTYELSEDNGQTTLTVTQGDYDTVAEGERRYNESYNNGMGWQPILEQIKTLVETPQ
ncbi:MAG: SRPBCC domain-containing protein [Saprospiraceae bacterium]|nr:SRPBCC domain-containing protein [Saprospiraceae bacterium]